MRLRASHRSFLAVALTVVLAGCSDGAGPPGEPDPGTVTYVLASPSGWEGGFFFSAPAAEVLAVEKGDGPTRTLTHLSGATRYVAVIYRFGSDDFRIELEVSDRSAPPELTLLSVVDGDNEQRSLGGYSLLALY